MEPRERKKLERDVREAVADADSPAAQRYIREMLKKNKFSSALMLLALLAPSAFLFSFYYAKMASIRENWRDLYELPPGFNPQTGQFDSDEAWRKRTEPPSAIILKSTPGLYGNKT